MAMRLAARVAPPPGGDSACHQMAVDPGEFEADYTSNELESRETWTATLRIAIG